MEIKIEEEDLAKMLALTVYLVTLDTTDDLRRFKDAVLRNIVFENYVNRSISNYDKLANDNIMTDDNGQTQ